MVTPIWHPPWRPAAPRPVAPRQLRSRGRAWLARLLAVLALLAVLLSSAALPALAQSGALYFVTLKRGVTDPGRSGNEDVFDVLDAGGHGPLQGEREAATTGLELDIYGVTRGSVGLGLGIEVLRYEKTYALQDGEQVHIRAKGVLFSLKTFLRLGDVFPFIGAGLGNYYVNYDQSPSGVSFRDAPDSVFNVRAGLRVLLGRLGLLLEGGVTDASLPISTDVGRANLELGGSYANVGLSWVF